MAASKLDPFPLRRCRSFEIIPPYMSELRVVLLGNNWSQTSFVGNLLLDECTFSQEREPQNFQIKVKEINSKFLCIINTPDLLQPDLTADRLTELTEEIAAISAPGPHVFLLVLQPEDFTEKHKTRLESVLEKFSEQAFQHSLVLICSPQTEKPEFESHLIDINIKCKHRYLWMNTSEQNFKQRNKEKFKELVSTIHKVLKDNHAKHLEYEPYEEPNPYPKSLIKPKETRTDSIVKKVVNAGISAFTSFPGKPQSQGSYLRILLLGKSDDKKSKLCNFIHASSGVWNKKPLTVVKTPDLFSLSVEDVREELRRCVSRCLPGPNVLLLLVKPSKFTEDNRKTLNFIMSLFGPDAYRHLIVVISHDEKEKSRVVNEVLCCCNGRFYNMFEGNRQVLMENIECIVQQNQESFLTIAQKTNREDIHVSSLNLVLCGRRQTEKISVVESLLGSAAPPTASSPGQCVRQQGEVCGRWVSLVELPALSGKPLEAVMQQCLSCISLCGPEGVHAFILVLPVGPLTDEDKAELKTIQDTFSSAVNLHTMILFTVDSDHTAPAVVNFVREDGDIQKLCKSYGGGSLILNTRGQQQVSELLDLVETLRTKNIPHSYTTETLVQGHLAKISDLNRLIEDMKRNKITSCGDYPSLNCLRIVLIGKTGSGKSSSGNTILGRKEFHAKSSQISVTKACDKKRGTVNGRHVAVVDTPGLFDTNMKVDEVNEELFKCISLLAPGPHVFLLVLQIGRLTKEENATLELIKTGFGKNAEKFTIVLFTRGDAIQQDGMSIEEFIESECDDSFKKLIKDCGNRYHVFNNYDNNDHSQVEKLMNKIEKLVEDNKGSYYTNDMLQEAEAAIQKEMERLLWNKEQEIKREKDEMQRKYQQELEEITQKMDKQKEEFEKERKLRDRELKEKEERVMEEKWLRQKQQDEREKEDKRRKEEEEQQRLEWEEKTKALEVKIESEQKSRESFEMKLQDSRRQMEEEREKWEAEQNKWWQKRKQDNEERQQLEEKREEEMRQIKREKQLKENELKETEEKIKEEQEQRRKEQEKREEEDRKRKEQEDKQRLEWEQKHSQLEEKIKSEEQSKETFELKLQESMKQMELERKQWEKEKKERLAKRKEDDEKTRKLEVKRQEEMKQIKMEKEQKEIELKAKEDKIKEEQELRKKDQEKSEEEMTRRKEQEEEEREKWEQKCKEFEEKIHAEANSKKEMEMKLQQSIVQMAQDKERWEKEREEWWQKREQEDEKRRHDEQQKIQKLQNEHEEERQRDQKKRLEEDQIRQEEEEKKRKELEEKYQTEIENRERKRKV